MIICERHWIEIRPEGREAAFPISISLPVNDGIEASCLVVCGKEEVSIRGIDNWNAIQSAMLFVAAYVKLAEDAGVKYLTPSGEVAGAQML